jgi:hypothetical protein
LPTNGDARRRLGVAVRTGAELGRWTGDDEGPTLRRYVCLGGNTNELVDPSPRSSKVEASGRSPGSTGLTGLGLKLVAATGRRSRRRSTEILPASSIAMGNTALGTA